MQPACTPSRDAWRVIAASVQGTCHRRMHQPCQDAAAWAMTPEGLLVAAVADGAGSAACGATGASLAAHTAVATLAPQATCGTGRDAAPWPGLLTEALTAARTALTQHAATAGLELHAYATTLLCVVVTPTLTAAAQIGDGALVVANAADEFCLVTTPQRGEYWNETTFLSAPQAVQHAQVSIWHGTAVSLALFSDGLQMLALDLAGGRPHPPFFRPLFQWLVQTPEPCRAQEQLARFLGSPRVGARTDDDITLLLATRVAGAA